MTIIKLVELQLRSQCFMSTKIHYYRIKTIKRDNSKAVLSHELHLYCNVCVRVSLNTLATIRLEKNEFVSYQRYM